MSRTPSVVSRLPDNAVSRFLTSSGNDDAGDVESQFHRRRDLIDVLAARPGGTHESLADLAFIELDPFGNADHRSR